MAQTGSVRIDRVADGEVARLTIDFPPVNAGSKAMRTALLAAIQSLPDGLRGVILTGAGGNFVGGADLKEFDHPAEPPHLPEIIAALEALPCPVVAAIDGAALGGGYELALGCDARIATPKAVVGLPEASLGLIPGAGGTVRLTRITPPAKAVDLITSGRRARAAEALTLGMIDAVAEGDLTEAALNHLAGMSGKRRLRDLPPLPDTDLAQAEAGALRKARGSNAVPAAIAALRDGLTHPVDEALIRERATSLELRKQPQSRALRHLFFAERQSGRIADAPAPRPLTTIGVVGGGRMGQGIVTALAQAGYSVRLAERDTFALDRAMAGLRDIAEGLVQRGRLGAADTLLDRVEPGGPDEMAGCDLVIEAIFEDMSAKIDLLETLERVCGPETLIASNTSYLDLNEMTAGLSHPERFAGLHFFNPAHVMKLVEVIRTDRSSPQTLASLVAVARKLRKVPVIAGVCDGFIGNRIFAAYREQADFLLLDGALPHQIDAAMQGFGMAMGPYQVFDLAGLEIAWAQRKRRAGQRNPAARYNPVADWLCEAGRLGRRAGRGWYDYRTDTAGLPDPEVATLIERASAEAGLARRDVPDTEIVSRLLSVMVNTACAILSEGIADRPGDIDLVLVHGYGFPKLKGGPLHWAAAQDRNGMIAAVHEMVAASGPGHYVSPNLEEVLTAATFP